MQVWESITLLEQVELLSVKDMSDDKIIQTEFVYQNLMYDNDDIVHKVVGNMVVSYATELYRKDLYKTLGYIFKTDKVILSTTAMQQLNDILDYTKEVQQ